MARTNYPNGRVKIVPTFPSVVILSRWQRRQCSERYQRTALVVARGPRRGSHYTRLVVNYSNTGWPGQSQQSPAAAPPSAPRSLCVRVENGRASKMQGETTRGAPDSAPARHEERAVPLMMRQPAHVTKREARSLAGISSHFGRASCVAKAGCTANRPPVPVHASSAELMTLSSSAVAASACPRRPAKSG